VHLRRCGASALTRNIEDDCRRDFMDTILAYLAGAIDAKGTIFIAHRKAARGSNRISYLAGIRIFDSLRFCQRFCTSTFQVASPTAHRQSIERFTRGKFNTSILTSRSSSYCPILGSSVLSPVDHHRRDAKLRESQAGPVSLRRCDRAGSRQAPWCRPRCMARR
jgi:hypothetical protein